MKMRDCICPSECGTVDTYDRAAKLSLLNFLSLFRDLQKTARFTVGGGGPG